MGEVIELPTPLVLERRARLLLRPGEVIRTNGGRFELLYHTVNSALPFSQLAGGPIANILEWLELRARVEAKTRTR